MHLWHVHLLQLIHQYTNEVSTLIVLYVDYCTSTAVPVGQSGTISNTRFARTDENEASKQTRKIGRQTLSCPIISQIILGQSNQLSHTRCTRYLTANSGRKTTAAACGTPTWGSSHRSISVHAEAWYLVLATRETRHARFTLGGLSSDVVFSSSLPVVLSFTTSISQTTTTLVLDETSCGYPKSQLLGESGKALLLIVETSTIRSNRLVVMPVRRGGG